MRTLTSATNSLAQIYWIPLAAVLLASCSGTGTNWNMSSLTGPAATPPAYTADQLAGRYGLAAFQRDEDRTRTETEARQQCRQPYEIVKGPGGGVVMHLADQSQPQELQLKGLTGGKTFIGPEGEAGGDQDREVVSFDGKVLVLRWVSSEIASRYGTAVYVRCEGTTPTTKRKSTARKTAAKSPSKAAPKAQKNTPVFMAPPQDPDDDPPPNNN
jgi:hypothetical protein